MSITMPLNNVIKADNQKINIQKEEDDRLDLVIDEIIKTTDEFSPSQTADTVKSEMHTGPEIRIDAPMEKDFKPDIRNGVPDRKVNKSERTVDVVVEIVNKPEIQIEMPSENVNKTGSVENPETLDSEEVDDTQPLL